MSSPRVVADALVIEAPAGPIFDVLADPARHGRIDGSGTLRGPRGGPARLSLGATFGMRMRWLGVPYRVTNRVIEFEEGRRIAWRTFGGQRWGYELQRLDDGATRVIETFDWSTARAPWVLERLGLPEHNRRAITATLLRLRDATTDTGASGTNGEE